MGKAAAIAASAVLAVFAALLAFLLIAPETFLEERLSVAVGRDVTMADASLHWRWDFRPDIVVTGLAVANPDWAEGESFVTADEVALRVSVFSLLTGNLDLPRLAVTNPKLDLVRNAEGDATWNMGDDGGGGSAGSIISSLGMVVVEGGRFSYRDATLDAALSGTFRTSGSEGDDEGEGARFLISGEGTYQDMPARGDVSVGGIHALVADADYPFAGTLTLGGTTLKAEGSIEPPLDTDHFEVGFTVAGPDLAATFPVFGIPLPQTPPYTLKGVLTRDGETWTFTDFAGTVGDSDLEGDVTVEAGGAKPAMAAELTSTRLDFDDLAGFVGAPPKTGEGETASEEQVAEADAALDDGRVIPDTPIDVSRLDAMDMDVSFKGDVIDAPGMPLTDVAFDLTVEDGALTAKPLAFTFDRGTVTGEAMLDGSGEVPRARADLSIADVGLQPFFEQTGFADETSGTIEGRITLEGQGRTVHEIVAGADGALAAVMREGSLSGLILELVDLDIAEALAIAFTEDGAVPIRCVAVRLEVADGVAAPRQLLIDTQDSTIVGEGSVNLATEELDLLFDSTPKDFSLLSANTPITVSGTFADPGFGLGGVPFPFPDFGDGEDANCPARVAEALGQ